MSRITLTALALAVVTLTGCAAVGPDYKKPSAAELALPAAWSAPTKASTIAPAPALDASAWWLDLKDPTLNDLVAASRSSSPSIDSAIAKLKQARAARGQTLANGYPDLTARTQGSRADTGAGKPLTGSTFSTDASWELDLFGAVKRGVEGADARVEAQVADLAAVELSLAADVVDAYSTYKQCQASLAFNQADLASRDATAKLTALKVDAGFTAPYLSARAQASVAEGQTQLANLTAQCATSLNLLVELTGRPRPELEAKLATSNTGVPRPDALSVSVPEAAVLSRPDMTAAERRLAAAAADIGLAEADLYPRLTLTGAVGYSVDAIGRGSVSAGNWSFGPSLSLPLLDGGKRKAVVAAAQATYDQVLSDYRLLARQAVADVENALTRYAAATDRVGTAVAAAQQYQVHFDANDALYREGVANLLELEDARRTLLSAQLTELSVQLERVQAWVSLHRATGSSAVPTALAIANSGPQS